MLFGRRVRQRGFAGPIVQATFAQGGAGATFSSLPASPTVTDFSTTTRLSRNTLNWRTWRMCATLASVTIPTARMGVQYSIDSGSTWFWMNGETGSAPATSEDPVVASAAAVTVSRTAVLPVPLEVRNSNQTLFRLAAYGGNGTASPVWRAIVLTTPDLVL